MTTLNQLKQKLQETFRDISASPVEIQETYGDCVIVKYEERDPITGGKTKDYLYTICDLDGKLVDEEHVYGDYELCRLVLHTCSMNNPVKIQEIVESYNAFQKILREAKTENEFYSGHEK